MTEVRQVLYEHAEGALIIAHGDDGGLELIGGDAVAEDEILIRNGVVGSGERDVGGRTPPGRADVRAVARRFELLNVRARVEMDRDGNVATGAAGGFERSEGEAPFVPAAG